MRRPVPAVDYHKLRLNNINSPEFRHLWLLLYWPIYGLAFLFMERFYPVSSYHVMHCALDDLIPFCEWFLIPYLFWFIFIVGILIYTLAYDTDAFRKFMRFVIITYSFSIFMYFIFPTCQELRPTVFARDNLFTRFLEGFYAFDTNTNVFPSVHVIGSLGVMFAAWQSKGLQHPAWKAGFFVTAVLIILSTMFIKQHSVWDVTAGILVSIVVYPFCFGRFSSKKRKETDSHTSL